MPLDLSKESPEARVRRLTTARRYQEKHREQINARKREQQQQKREADREGYREYFRVYRSDESNATKHRLSSAMYYRKNRAARIAQQSAYAKAHPEKTAASRQRRRAREVGAEGCFTGADVRHLFHTQSGRCCWCNADLADGYHVDHLVPLSRGGSNKPENIGLSCPGCNVRKGAKTPSEFVAYLTLAAASGGVLV